ncbi:hypothetical protein L3X38_036027 [Prunus dulcis]|uniref:Reverse transcriptase Ty1/copia-type domain-containing protein n=1 Tax=Prunus dulcis TaxID=3755 RepID=A0AAD4V0G8_PRUDU|nr:hypothetical protein L3X38_036027 [Prunus dulcis]
MRDEYDALMRNHTWSLVPATSCMNIVGCKWVFKVKRKADGSIDRYKARPVTKGFNQKEGFDYEETFSPVVKPATIHTILSLAVSYNWSLQQLDVRNAFLNGYLQEEVYMKQPPGFHDSSPPQYVSRLHEALYGLKQAPQAWFQRLSTFLLAERFVHSHSDASLFIRLSSSCTIRRMGELNFFLGMEINRFSNNLFLSQTRYAVDLLKRFNMTECKSCPTPLPSDTRLSCMDGDPLPDTSNYRSMVGGLQYLTLSRPDISFAVNQSTVSLSSTEAKYRALANTVAEIRWFGYLFRELGIPLRSAPCIYVDNISAIYMAANPIFHARTRHIEIDYHFVRELVARKALHTLYVPSSHQLADIFTKGLNHDRFSLLKSKLNLRVAPLRLREGKENHDAYHDSTQSAHSMKSVDPTQLALTDSTQGRTALTV